MIRTGLSFFTTALAVHFLTGTAQKPAAPRRSAPHYPSPAVVIKQRRVAVPRSNPIKDPSHMVRVPAEHPRPGSKRRFFAILRQVALNLRKSPI